MANSEFWHRASAVAFQREMNRLFWIEELQGAHVRDLGWSCREHAWALTLLARAANLPAFVMNGLLTHVLPANKHGLINSVGTHSWIAVEGQGLFDFSAKATLHDPQSQVEHPIPKVMYSRPIPPSWGSVVPAGNDREFRKTISDAHGSMRRTAIYLGLSLDTPLPEMVENACEYINSPLTDRLKSTFREDIYAKGLLYLNDVLFSRRRPASSISSSELWAQIDIDFVNAVPLALRLAKLA